MSRTDFSTFFALVEEEYGRFLYKEDGSPNVFREIPYGGTPSSVRSQALARQRRAGVEQRSDRPSGSPSPSDSGISG